MRKGCMKKISAKKRMMFVQNNDFNFLSYMVLLTLEKLSCTSEKKPLIDYRKIAFIANMIFWKNKTDWNKIYYESQISIKTLDMIIQSLDKKGVVSVKLNDKRKTVDVWISDRTLSKLFLDEAMFAYELMRLEEIRVLDNRLRTSKLSTFLDNQFSRYGVKIWEV